MSTEKAAADISPAEIARLVKAPLSILGEHHLLKNVNNALNQLLSHKDTDQAVEAAFRIICEATDCDGLLLFRYDKIELDVVHAQVISSIRWSNGKWHLLPDHTIYFPVEMPEVRDRLNSMLHQGTTTIVSNRQVPPKLKGVLQDLDIASYISFRIVVDGSVFGSMGLVTRQPVIPYAEAYGRLLTSFANTVGNFLVRKQAEQELVAQRNYFHQIIDLSPNFIFAKNLSGVFTLVNQAMAKANNKVPEEMIGKHLRYFLSEETEVQRVLEEDQIVIQENKPVIGKIIEITTFEKEKFYAQLSKIPLIAADGVTKEVISVLTDLTEVKKAEQKLIAEKQFSESITNTIPDGILIVDYRARRINYHNMKFPILGFSEAEAPNLFDLMESRLHPDEQHLLALFYKRLETSMPDDIIETYSRFQYKDGPWLYFYTRVKVISRREDHSVKEYLMVIQNVTELKKTEIALQQSESILKATINALPDLKFRIAKDGTYLNFYESGNETLRPYAPPTVMLGNKVQDVMPPDLAAIMMEKVRKAVEQHTIEVLEYELSIAGEGMQYRETRISPINDKEVIAVVRDISERKHAEKALQQSQERYLNFIKHSHEGIYYMNCDKPIPLDLSFDEMAQLFYENAYIEECNEAMARMYGTTLEQLKNTRAITLHSGEHFEENKESFKDLIKNGFRVSNAETIEPDVNGNFKYFLNNAVGVIENGHLTGFWGTQTDITERKQIQLREKSRTYVLELLSQGASLPTIMNAIVSGIEQQKVGMLGSIMLADKEGERLYMGAAPSLPDFYNKAVSGIEIRMGVGSCGTCAFTGERVIVEDIQTHPYWNDYKELAAQADLRSCWSEPIKDNVGKVLGTFGIYQRVVSKPSQDDIELIKQAADLVSIVLNKFHTEEVLRASEEKFHSMVHNISDIITLLDENGIITYQSSSITQVLGFDEQELIGKSMFELLHPDDRAKVAQGFENTLKNPGNGRVLEFKFLTKSGNYTLLEGQGNNQLHNPAIKGVIVSSRDISKRKKEEEHLKLLQSAITNSNDAVIITEAEPFDEPGPKILYVNEAFTKMTGYTDAEVMGKTPRLLQGPKSDRVALARLKNAFKNWESCVIETINYKKNGEEFWVNLTIVPIADEKGFFTHWVSVQRDITERKHAEEYLRLNEERWKFAIAGSNDGMWDWNVVTNKVFFSDRWKEMLGFEAHEIQDTLEEWSKRVHPDEVDWINQNLQKTFRDASHIYIVEHRLLCKDGNYKWIMARGKVLVWNDDGTPARMVGTHTDISERKQAENTLEESRSLLKAIIDALPDLKFRVNNEGLFLDYYESEHENEPPVVPPAVFIGKTMHEILPSFVADVGLQSIQNAITRQKIETFEYFMPMEKELSYYEGRASPFGEGEVIMAIRNITDRKKAQVALQEKIRELDEKNKELTLYVASNIELKNFAYIASHDLREPIRTMHSFAQLLKKNYIHLLDEKGNDHLDFIISAAENMNHMIEDLLAYSLVNSEKHTVQSVELPSLLKSVIESLTISIKEKQAVIYLEEFPAIIQANRVRLRQLFQNLISNAIKFHHQERSPIIHITGIEQEDYWLFEVKDNGIGIPETMEQKIFQLFKKIHSNPAHVGTGIGLALCQRIVEHHGGEIWVESEPGVGSSFYFTIKK